MASDKSGSGVSTTGLASVTAAVVMAVFFGVSPALRDNRPPIPGGDQLSSGIQQIDSRLWDDPFAVTQRAALEQSGFKPPCVASDPKLNISSDPKLNLSTVGAGGVILALVPGGPYEPAAEARRQTRYAVVTALHGEGLQPVDSEHIGCLVYNPPYGAPKFLPFERFSTAPTTPTADTKLLLWIDENLLLDEQNPSVAIRKMVSLAAKVFSLGTQTQRNVAVIGPYSSYARDKLVSEKCSEPATNGTSQQASATNQIELTFFNYGATASQPEEKPGCTTNHFFDVVNSDENIASALQEEFELRLRKPVNTRRFALISEFDTTYSNALARTIGCTLLGVAPSADQCARKLADQVVRLTYLRSLAGELPGPDGSTQRVDQRTGPNGNGAGAIGAAKQTNSTAGSDVAQGNAQFDYVERIALELDWLEKHYMLGGPAAGSFDAIGLLGNDIYDKLLLLRELKPRFPNAIFFTTDIDARMYDPAEIAATRGLITASSFGLWPRFIWPPKGEFPPVFRDTYEASAYLATQLASRYLPQGAPAHTPNGLLTIDKPTIEYLLAKWHQKPVLFEIIGSGTIPLRIKTLTLPTPPKPMQHDIEQLDISEQCLFGSVAAKDSGKNNSKCRYDHHPPFNLHVKFTILALMILAWSILVADLGMVKRTAGDARLSQPGWASRSSAVTLLVTAAGLLAMNGLLPGTDRIVAFLESDGLGEPALLTSGSSLWPTIELRMLGTVFCFWAFWVVMTDVRRNGQRIQQDFDFNPPDMGKEPVKLRKKTITAHNAGMNRERIYNAYAKRRRKIYLELQYLKQAARAFRRGLLEDNPGGIYTAANFDKTNAQEIWEAHSPRARVPRLFRACLYTIGVVLIFVVMACTCENFLEVQARGGLAFWSYWISYGLNVISLTALVTLVCDTAAFSCHVMELLKGARSGWPEKYFLNHCGSPSITRREFRVDDEGLKGIWLLLQVVGIRTRALIELIYYPVIGLTIFALSCSTLLSGVPLRWPDMAFISFGFALVIVTAWSLNSEAESVRNDAVDYLDNAMAAHHRTAQDYDDLAEFRTQFANFDMGAFKPFTRQPIFKALLLPVLCLVASALLPQIMPQLTSQMLAYSPILL